MHKSSFFHLIDNDQGSQKWLFDAALQCGMRCQRHGDVQQFLANGNRDGVVLLHDNRPTSLASDLLQNAARSGRWLGVVGFCSEPDVEKVVAAMKAGALSFHKTPSTSDELAALIDNAETEMLTTFKVRAESARAHADMIRLSARERQVLDRVANGESNKEIARLLNISPRTVELHRTNMMGKLGAKNAAEAIRLCLTAAFSVHAPPASMIQN
ncbi:MAG: LuxR C-terminal-related transcriptional regulator [Novosphingobium sp.]|uniref:response regulator transcription factor n=1 Tax=Novosphingobium sp. TaxID=1874826 RepID=UPI00273394F5|nr:LuxR C-terminal-related transcriptional regulator [Novosphingobium sp.]MDP3549641.1 LuxR C-terminal-related transcriptional regulator [Novosphingobium sp.]